MKVTLRSDKDNRLGFVEKYAHYFYEDRRVSVLGMAEVGGYFSEPYVLRGEEFIPAAQIEEEMGISKYLKAKKPFYSVIGTGNIVVSAKIAMTMGEKKVYIPEKSVYGLYFLDKNSLKPLGNGEWEANLKKVSSTNERLEAWFHQLGEQFVQCGHNRELFLKSRFVK